MDNSKRLSMHDMFRSADAMLTSAQLYDLGLTRQEIDWAVKRGDLVVRRRGVYEPPGIPDSPSRHQRAALLAAGPDGVLSHFGAAGAAGFPRIVPGAVELSFRRLRAGRLVGVTCHAAPDLDDLDITTIDDRLCTTMPRSLLDIGPLLHPQVVQKIVAFIERKLRPNGFELIEDAASRISPKRRPQIEPTLAIVRSVRDGDDRELDVRTRCIRAMERLGLPPLVEEHPVTWEGHDHVLDGAYVAERIDVEFDDDATHATVVGSHADKDRDLRGERCGWAIVRAHQAVDAAAFARHVAWLLEQRRRPAA